MKPIRKRHDQHSFCKSRNSLYTIIDVRLCHNPKEHDNPTRTITSMPKRTISAIDIYIGERIRLRRQFMDKSQSFIGKILNISYQQVQKIEQANNKISASALLTLARAIDVDYRYFLDGAPAADDPSSTEQIRRMARDQIAIQDPLADIIDDDEVATKLRGLARLIIAASQEQKN